MTEWGFYHLTRTSIEAAAPRLLGRVLDSGGRALVLCASHERAAALDNALWTAIEPVWLPHGMVGGAQDAHQPILLASDDVDAPNGARFLLLIDGAACNRIANYDRVLDLFDGHDEAAVAAARQRWTEAKAAGHVLSYWQQGTKGWEKKA